ncbi:hypothetical protein [Nonomuraea recticatena]|uniref:Uncharacterized protein n=1 Tax=Nonomuraea recticatena TaxID=46178 RepID=A0ABN3RPH3_9ACTN
MSAVEPSQLRELSVRAAALADDIAATVGRLPEDERTWRYDDALTDAYVLQHHLDKAAAELAEQRQPPPAADRNPTR